MSALIKIARTFGADVTGSDRVPSETLDELKRQGFDVYVGSDPSYARRADLVVYNAAIGENDEERLAAGNSIGRAEFLSEICESFEKTVAVSGTHGKTTVSAMIASCLAASKKEFSAHIGGVACNFNDNIFLSGREIFVTEACEYKDSFLALSPDVAIILNAEHDHGDYFQDIQSVYDSFSEFAKRIKPSGSLILGENASSHIHICADQHLNVYKYGESFSFEPTGERGGFLLRIKGAPDRFFVTPAKGKHNLYNAAIAAFASLLIGVSEDEVRMGLAAFLGVKRRYERMGQTARGATVIHDYAHHPSEIEAVLSVARAETHGRLFVVFEPHTYSRTKLLFDDFCSVLSKADVLIILPTFAARETSEMGVDGKTLFCACNAPQMYYFATYDGAFRLLNNVAKGEDTVLILGAGKVEALALKFSDV